MTCPATPVKKKSVAWKKPKSTKMMNLFSRQTHQKNAPSVGSSIDGNLTALDPPMLNGVPYYAHSDQSFSQASIGSQPKPSISIDRPSSQDFGHLAQKHALQFTMRANTQDPTPEASPTASDFQLHANRPPQVPSSSTRGYGYLEAGLAGEKERNQILEEQVKMLSHQAALALDRLSEVSKENTTLKEDNERLAKRAGRFSLVRRQGSTSSTETSVSSGNASVFSSKESGMSQASSISSLKSHLVRRNSMYLDELAHSYEKEVNGLKQQLVLSNEVVVKTQVELEQANKLVLQLQNELKHNEETISFLRHKVDEVSVFLEDAENENKKLWKRLTTKNKQTEAQIKFYKDQLSDLIKQLMERQEKDLDLRARLMTYSDCKLGVETANTLLTHV